MTDSTIAYSTVHLNAGASHPAYHCESGGVGHIVRLTGTLDLSSIYLQGTLDELAAFVLELAGVVRELDAKERAAIDQANHESLSVRERELGRPFDRDAVRPGRATEDQELASTRKADRAAYDRWLAGANLTEGSFKLPAITDDELAR